MEEPLIIASRFRGPPRSGNGGYSCGLVGSLIEGPARVRLRIPPPLDTPMHTARDEDGRLTLYAGEDVVAVAEPTDLEAEIPARIDIETARAASARFAWRTNHPYPMCFVCGPDRDDGLRIFPGTVPDVGVAAAPWIPDPSLGDVEMPAPITWAALDCTSWFGVYAKREWKQPVLLGEMTARINRAPRVRQEYVAVGWLREVDGRKVRTASAILDANAKALAVAHATWIAVPENLQG